MTDFSAIFEAAATEGRIFADKSALDPLDQPEAIVGREDQQQHLARILRGIETDYLPPTISIHGPPGTGKTVTCRELCSAFADRHDEMAVEYVNLKECTTVFSAANEILFEITGERALSYVGLDGIFDTLWKALEEYPSYLVLLLDEVDAVTQDANYDPNDFFYRLIRGERRSKADLTLSLVLISNQLLEADLRLGSRIQSAIGDEAIFFGYYAVDELEAILTPRLERAFLEDALPEDVARYGLGRAADNWGDVRKAMTLFRHAGEAAIERELDTITPDCIDEALPTANRLGTVETLEGLPRQHLLVLYSLTEWGVRRDGSITQPVSVEAVYETYASFAEESPTWFTPLSRRRVRGIIDELETNGIVQTWVERKPGGGRAKHLETSVEPSIIRTAASEALGVRV